MYLSELYVFNFRKEIVWQIKVGNFRTRCHKNCDIIQIVLDFENGGTIL